MSGSFISSLSAIPGVSVEHGESAVSNISQRQGVPSLIMCAKSLMLNSSSCLILACEMLKRSLPACVASLTTSLVYVSIAILFTRPCTFFLPISEYLVMICIISSICDMKLRTTGSPLYCPLESRPSTSSLKDICSTCIMLRSVQTFWELSITTNNLNKTYWLLATLDDHAKDAGIGTRTLGDLLCQLLLEGSRNKVRLGLKYACDVLNKLKQLY